MTYKGPELLFEYVWWAFFGSTEGQLMLGVVALNLTLIALYRHLFMGNSFHFFRLTIPSFFLTTYCAILLLPAIIFYQYSSDPEKYIWFAAIQIVPILFLLGVTVANGVDENGGEIAKRFLTKGSLKSDLDPICTKIYYVFLFIIAGIVFWYIKTAAYVPLIGAITHYGQASADQVRFSIYELPAPLVLAYATAARLLMPFCLMFAFLMAKNYGGSWWIRFGFTFVFALFVSLLSLERQHALALFVLLGLTAYFSQRRRISPMLWVGAIALSGLAGGLVSRAQYNTPIKFAETVSYGLFFLFSRVWIDPAYMTYKVIETFSVEKGLLLGRCIKLLSPIGACPEHGVGLTAIGFVADFWINFGWLGVILGPFLYGLSLQLVQLYLFRERTIPSLMFFLLFLLNSVWTIYGNMFSTMVILVFVGGIFTLMLIEKLRRYNPTSEPITS